MMNIIYKDIYSELFEKKKNTITSIKILVGYSGIDILEKLVADFPRVKIDLIIGMAREGIYMGDHIRYKELTFTNNNVNVYYHIMTPKNHIKLYVFNDSYSYVGSANFSKLAFSEHQEELLVRVEDNFNDIICKAFSKSVICTDEDKVSSFIFSNSEDIPTLNSIQNEMKDKTDSIVEPTQEQDKLVVVKKEINTPTNNKVSVDYYRKPKLRNFPNLIRAVDWRLRKDIEVTPVLPKERDIRWDMDGINTPASEGDPHLIATNANDFRNFFGTQPFTLHIENEGEYETFQAHLGGNFHKKLMFDKKFDIYQYLKGFTNIIEERPLSYNDLIENNIKHLKFTRLNESEYFLEVIKK